MPEPSYLALVQELVTFEPSVFVFGGIAEDALLDGAISRPHGDLDVLVARGTHDRHLRDLRSLGFSEFEVLFESPPGVSLVLGATRGAENLELGVFDELEPGIPSFVLPVDDGLVRISLSDDALRHPIASIDGVPIRTLSPTALYELRAAFILTGAFGPERDKDRAAQARLHRELLADTPEDELSPRMIPMMATRP